MSRYTRIILISGDDGDMREFSITHRMVWLLAVLGLLLAATIAYVLITHGAVVRQAGRVPALEAEVEAARVEVARVEELRAEVAAMRGFQAQLLRMLGVDPADSAGAVAAGDDLSGLASAVMTPPPDAWPAAGYVTREFAEGATARGERPHPGLDIAGPTGSPILAAGDGVVARTGEDPFLGNFVEIQHGLGYLTVYGHCQSAAVARGERVRRGQVVAYLGDTGEASAPHLHFEIWQNGMAVDPREFLAGEPPTP
jgi:murein DD-endopeptidase MepM/ murein hydrolase activator NlpD